MSKLDNITKLKVKGMYIGHTRSGHAREIRSSNSSYGKWCAYPHINEGVGADLAYAWTLDELSILLKRI